MLILLVFGVNCCRNSAKENALKDYNRNVTAVIKDSDDQVGPPLFELLNNAAARSPRTSSLQVNQLRAGRRRRRSSAPRPSTCPAR